MTGGGRPARAARPVTRAVTRAVTRPVTRAERPEGRRYTIDASVFVNAFNPHEKGHAQSFDLLSAIQERGDPVIVPTLLVPEIASAIARTTDDETGAIRYAAATAAFPNLTLVALTPAMASDAAELASRYRLRGADAVYLAVARRYETTLVSRDREQLARGAAVGSCQSPEEALARA